MTAYRKFFSLSVNHNYYEDNLCEDLSFMPTADSMRIMRNQHWLYKPISSGFDLICEVDGDLNAIIEIAKTPLTFGIKLKSAAKFLGITNLHKSPSKQFGSNKKIYFTNTGLDQRLEYTILDDVISNGIYLAFIEEGHEKVSLKVSSAASSNHIVEYDSDGMPISGPYEIAKNNQNLFTRSLNFSKLPDGLYQISIKKSAGTGADLQTYQVYKSADLSSASIFGVLDLRIPPADDVITENKFLMQFIRKETIWKYYIVNRTGIDLEDFKLLLKDNSKDGTPEGNSAYAKYTFSGTTVQSSDTEPINKVDANEKILFTSSAKIPFFSRVKTGLQLTKKDPTNEVILISDLPNPRPETQVGEESKIYIYV
ncbi:hypothetical protein [Pedobacter sandarakinus]|uniref:hypothetical protein n=1 Tax=Pedobacter sandarakinus TaxID=353156 RepID=UPI002248419E|nr:hypothetical protein [Pedobacter sandarakinus]MCX2574547.1 hypothetical protein [Pedobacter sandarakinus]